MVDGCGAGIQWCGRYTDTYVDQYCILLDDPDSIVILSGDHAGLAAYGGFLGGVFFGDVGGIVYALVVYEREVEDGEAVKCIEHRAESRGTVWRRILH